MKDYDELLETISLQTTDYHLIEIILLETLLAFDKNSWNHTIMSKNTIKKQLHKKCKWAMNAIL